MATGTILEKLFYGAQLARRRIAQPAPQCPNCSSPEQQTIDTKLVFIQLRECLRCHLFYRFPTDTEADNHKFYQVEYNQGFTTDMPLGPQLAHLQKIMFADTEKSYAGQIEVLTRLGVAAGARIYDFGCSWGYGSWQLMAAGYNVRAFEISRPRREYAKTNLGVVCDENMQAVLQQSELRGAFDVFFSNHVMEHVPRPQEVIAMARTLVRQGGLFVAITPNGSLDYRNAAPRAWHKSWGKVHPNLLGDRFWRTSFADNQYLIRSLDGAADDVASWIMTGGQVVKELIGPELLCVARLT